MRPVDKVALFFSFLASVCVFMAIYGYVHGAAVAIVVATTLQPFLYLFLCLLHRTERIMSRAEDLSELEFFMSMVAAKLRLGLSIEAAFHEACLEYRGRLKELLENVDRKLMEGLPLSLALSGLSRSLRSREARRLLMLAPRLTEYSSKKAGVNLYRLVTMLRRNRKLKDRLWKALRAEDLKVKLLSIIYAAVLASLAHLARLLGELVGFSRPLDMLFTFLPLAFMSIVTPFYATLIVQGEKPLLRSITSLSVFLAFYVLLYAIV